jgi:hypothetical protein
MPKAQSADGVIHDFPEGIDPGVMDRVMKDYAAQHATPPVATPPTEPPKGGALFGATQLLPEGVQKHLPSFLSGPSVGERLTAERQAVTSQEQRLGRPLGLAERLKAEPVMDSPVAAGFATHQVGELSGAMAGATKSAGEKFIKDQYDRVVKPTVSGKTTAGQLDRYHEQARDAVDSIVANKPNLQFTDEAGNVRAGDLPKSLEEFGDAVEQTKQGIFTKYDALAKQTQGAGMDVSLMPAVTELQAVVNDPVTGLMHPELVKYAQDRADAFSLKGQLTATDAQRAVTSLNSTLKAFYRNPTYETAARANVDALIANQLRAALDQAVENAVGPGYQELKNQYGALKTIEKDVTHRAQIVGRQEKGGGILGRIADVGSAEEVIRGLVTLNPAAVVRGAALKGWSEYVKYLRSPNRAVTRLFKTAEQQQTPPNTAPIVPSMPLSPVLPANDSNDPAAKVYRAWQP